MPYRGLRSTLQEAGEEDLGNWWVKLGMEVGNIQNGATFSILVSKSFTNCLLMFQSQLSHCVL